MSASFGKTVAKAVILAAAVAVTKTAVTHYTKKLLEEADRK